MIIYKTLLHILYNITILNKPYEITRDALCKILEKSKDDENMRLLFYTVFDWMPKNYE